MRSLPIFASPINALWALDWTEDIPSLALTLAYITRMHGPIEEGVTVLETALAYELPSRDKLNLKISSFKDGIVATNGKVSSKTFSDVTQILKGSSPIEMLWNCSWQKPVSTRRSIE